MIGLSTTYYATKGNTIYESIAKIVALGFDTVEIGAAHVFEENVWGALRKIKEDFPDINFTVHNLFPPLKHKFWFNPSDGLSEVNIGIIDNLFEAAKILEASLISIHPPVLNEVSIGGKVVGNFDRPLMGRLKDKDTCRNNFNLLMNYVSAKAGTTGIRVAVENMDTNSVKTILNSSGDFIDMFKQYPGVGFLLDVAHALLDKNLDELVKLDGNIYELHLHDLGNVSRRRNWAHFAIRNKKYFEPIKRYVLDRSVPKIFEHGADISENEMIQEKKLLEEFIAGI